MAMDQTRNLTLDTDACTLPINHSHVVRNMFFRSASYSLLTSLIRMGDLFDRSAS